MTMKGVYIQAAEQISLQNPLSEEWMSSPILYDVPYARVIDPDFKQWLSPVESRRLGKILKRALATSMRITERTGIEHPDAIMVGSGLGCMENTERFLEALCNNGESMLSPTHFMQSTHNTIASLMAIHSKTHGYNITYSHKDLSFDLALHDAWIQFQLGKIHTAIVGGYDELTPSYFTLLHRIGYMGCEGEDTGSEASAAIALSDTRDSSLCELAAMRILYRPTKDEIGKTLKELIDEAGVSADGIDAIVTGIDGRRSNDNTYSALISDWLPNTPTLHYKHLFGVSYTASAYAVYVAAHVLSSGRIPAILHYGQAPLRERKPEALLLVNQRDAKHFSFIILKAVC